MSKVILKLCDCGCGNSVGKQGNRYVHGHSRKGKKLSKETRKRISESNKGVSRGVGKDNPFYGKTHSKEVCEKISESHKGKPSPKRIPDNEKVKIKCENPECNKTILKRKKSIRKYCNRKCEYGDRSRKRSGSNSPNWQGGLSKQDYDLKFNKQLREEIRKRDNYTCQECSITEKELKKKFHKKLDVHHIDYNKKNNKKKNLISLCKSCHMGTNSNRDEWKKYFKEEMAA